MERNPPAHAPTIEQPQNNSIFPFPLPIRFQQIPLFPFTNLPMPFLLHSLLFRPNGIPQNVQSPSKETAQIKQKQKPKLMSIETLLAAEDKKTNIEETSNKQSGSSANHAEKVETNEPALGCRRNRKKSRGEKGTESVCQMQRQTNFQSILV